MPVTPLTCDTPLDASPSAREDAAAPRDAELLRERRLRVEAEAAARNAQAASRIKDEFLATLSHELRTPLNAILGWTQTLRRGGAGTELLPRALAQIEESAQAQARLIDDLLNVSDIVAGRLRLDVQPMPLVRSVSAVIEAIRPMLEEKSLRLESDFCPLVIDDGPSPTRSPVVYGDPVRIQQIVWNLLSNAVKFTPSGGHIRVGVAREGTEARLDVTDSGEGIRAEFLPQVFDRFSQADASSRRRHGGLGIGLAITRYLVQLHGGTVQAHSAGEGEGSTFTVRLPLRMSAVDETSGERPRVSPSPRAAAARSARLSGLRILTVDDDRNTREMLQEALRSVGAEVLTAESVRDALRKLQAFQPDVLVSDIGMPSEDGYDLMRQVRRLAPAEGGRVPAVALTGYAREEDRVLTWRAGFQAMIPKPVSLDELISTLAALARR